MRICYDPETDILTVRLSERQIADSDEPKPGVIVDFDADGHVVSFEVLDASEVVPDFNTVTWELERHPPSSSAA
jgi:uncharacterized protein YuzE